MAKVGIGIIGCGKRIRGVVGRIPGIGEDIEVTALMDVSAESIQATQEKVAPNAKIYEDYHQLVRDPSVDWVFIGSFNALHRVHAVAALEAGKHVFCEKPLATNLEDALAMRDAWRASGKLFAMGFVLRYSAHYQAIRDLVARGELGRIVSMEFNETLHFEHGSFIHRNWRRLTKWAGSHILEKCCHDVDLVNWIVDSLPRRVAGFGGLNFLVPENKSYIEKLGPNPKTGKPAFSNMGAPSELDSFSADKDILDNQVAILEFANGVRASFHTNCCTNLPERRMYICGTEGTLRADVLSGQIEYKRIGHEEALIPVETGARGGHGGADSILCNSLRDSLLEGTPPLATPDDGLKAAIACFGVDRATEKGQVVDLSAMWKQAGIELNAAASRPEPVACVG